jgi:hypothetical protein
MTCHIGKIKSLVTDSSLTRRFSSPSREIKRHYILTVALISLVSSCSSLPPPSSLYRAGSDPHGVVAAADKNNAVTQPGQARAAGGDALRKIRPMMPKTIKQ